MDFHKNCCIGLMLRSLVGKDFAFQCFMLFMEVVMRFYYFIENLYEKFERTKQKEYSNNIMNSIINVTSQNFSKYTRTLIIWLSTIWFHDYPSKKLRPSSSPFISLMITLPVYCWQDQSPYQSYHLQNSILIYWSYQKDPYCIILLSVMSVDVAQKKDDEIRLIGSWNLGVLFQKVLPARHNTGQVIIK